MYHPIVMMEMAGVTQTAAERLADPWTNWLLSWLWECVFILTVNAPAEIMKTFLETTMTFLLDHPIGGGGGH
tara:strand:+ start:165 stop:380 length:216 start_codon:yes stop_codon:yes gene_type:complete